MLVSLSDRSMPLRIGTPGLRHGKLNKLVFRHHTVANGQRRDDFTDDAAVTLVFLCRQDLHASDTLRRFASGVTMAVGNAVSPVHEFSHDFVISVGPPILIRRNDRSLNKSRSS